MTNEDKIADAIRADTSLTPAQAETLIREVTHDTRQSIAYADILDTALASCFPAFPTITRRVTK